MPECPSCGAPDLTPGGVCASCGAAAPAAPDEVRDKIGVPEAAPRESIPADLPPAREARRIRGLAVPIVAALLVVGIGYPLTALAVIQVGRLPSTPPGPEDPGEAFLAPSEPGVPAGRARLTGAVVFDGPAAPLGCQAGGPKLVTAGTGAESYSILLNLPAGSGPGAYPLESASTTFVSVSRSEGTQAWSSLRRPRATGTINVGADGSLSARFQGLEATGGGAAGTVGGTVEVRCG